MRWGALVRTQLGNSSSCPSLCQWMCSSVMGYLWSFKTSVAFCIRYNSLNMPERPHGALRLITLLGLQNRRRCGIPMWRCLFKWQHVHDRIAPIVMVGKEIRLFRFDGSQAARAQLCTPELEDPQGLSKFQTKVTFLDSQRAAHVSWLT
eukprot:3637300-Amphidinium_carterae.2